MRLPVMKWLSASSVSVIFLCLMGCGGSGSYSSPGGSVSSSSASSETSSSSSSSSSSTASSDSSSSSSSTAAPPEDEVKHGYLLDTALEGLHYTSARLAGTTGPDGRFEYVNQEPITFFIGDLSFPAVEPAPTLTPLAWFNTSDPSAPAVVNSVRLLLSLDDDGEWSNGIKLPSTVADAAVELEFDQPITDFESDPAVTNFVANAGAHAATLVGAEAALQHFQGTLANEVNDRTLLIADGTGETYELINATLGGTAVETPVCDEATDSYGRRITDPFDETLQAHVFAFHLVRDVDGDRCREDITDRQRIEIKTYSQSPEKLLGREGESHSFSWKFKLDEGFQASSSFTHLFQLKPVGGDDVSLPILIFTARAGSPDELEVNYNPDNNVGSSAQKLATVALSELKGHWVEAFVRLEHKNDARAEISLRRLSDGVTLIDWSSANIDLWRPGSSFNRPKWGIYRSLNNASALRDETVWFHNFCIAEGTNTCPYGGR